jgi:tripartite-type tricarboxylate transporter receptor subunit TctC
MNAILRVLFVTFALVLAANAGAQAFPSKSIRFVVPYPAGGTTDIMARLIATRLSERVKQPVVIDNRPGAGGNIGVAEVAKAPADGYTIGISATNSFAINPHMTKNPPYDALKDLAPVTMVGVIPSVIIVNVDVPAKTLGELLALAKKQPVAFASPGAGTSLHLTGEILNEAAGVEMTHVPYKGDAQAMQDLLGGRIPVMMANLALALPQIRAGKVRALAVTIGKRAAQLPDVPTVAESGFKDFDISVWFTVFTAAAVPKDALDVLYREISRIVDSPDFKSRMSEMTVDAYSATPAQMRQFIAAEYERWGRIVRKTGASFD